MDGLLGVLSLKTFSYKGMYSINLTWLLSKMLLVMIFEIKNRWESL